MTVLIKFKSLLNDLGISLSYQDFAVTAMLCEVRTATFIFRSSNKRPSNVSPSYFFVQMP